MFELFMCVYSCNALSARFFAVDRALNSYFMIMIMNNVGISNVISTLEFTPIVCSLSITDTDLVLCASEE